MNAPLSSEEIAERISRLIDRSRAFQKTLAGPDEHSVGRVIGLLCKALEMLDAEKGRDQNETEERQ